MALTSESNLASPDRVLVLEPIDGKKPLSSTGLVDPRLFTGGNKLHAIMDKQTSLWTLKYDDGLVPPALRSQYTGFRILKEHCEQYFAKRNMRIKEVIHN